MNPAFAGFPLTDPRAKLLAAKLTKECFRPDALIEVLHAAQNAYGYLPMPALKFIAKALHLPPARVLGMVTFYCLITASLLEQNLVKLMLAYFAFAWRKLIGGC